MHQNGSSVLFPWKWTLCPAGTAAEWSSHTWSWSSPVVSVWQHVREEQSQVIDCYQESILLWNIFSTLNWLVEGKTKFKGVMAWVLIQEWEACVQHPASFIHRRFQVKGSRLEALYFCACACFVWFRARALHRLFLWSECSPGTAELLCCTDGPVLCWQSCGLCCFSDSAASPCAWTKQPKQSRSRALFSTCQWGEPCSFPEIWQGDPVTAPFTFSQG